VSELDTDGTLVSVHVVHLALQRLDLRVRPQALRVRLCRLGCWTTLTASSGVIRPSGTTAVASTVIPCHPRKAIEPMCTKWWSVACPLSDESDMSRLRHG
jgi:hypothetical protein